jgi:hypothetical protein
MGWGTGRKKSLRKAQNRELSSINVADATTATVLKVSFKILGQSLVSQGSKHSQLMHLSLRTTPKLTASRIDISVESRATQLAQNHPFRPNRRFLGGKLWSKPKDRSHAKRVMAISICERVKLERGIYYRTLLTFPRNPKNSRHIPKLSSANLRIPRESAERKCEVLTMKANTATEIWKQMPQVRPS